MRELRSGVMRFALLVIVAACGAGTRAPRAQPAIGSDAPPGTRWITPVSPWHLSDGAGGLVVTGNIALAAGVTRGEIEEIDLTTGNRGRVHSLGKPLTVQSFSRLSDGRYLVAGTLDEQVHAAVLDPTTFAPTWFDLQRLSHDDSYTTAGALELADHSILITGIDLALAVYDPITLKQSRVLVADASWTDVAASNTAIYARRSTTAGAIKLDLATGKTTTPTTSMMDAAGTIVVERAYEKGQVKFRVVDGTARRDLPSTLGFSASLDDAGARVASLRNGVVTVYSTTDGSVLGRFDLSPQTLYGAKLVFAGDRLVIASGGTLRIADLATRSLTSVPEPYGPYAQLAVDDTGTVTAIGAEVWRFHDGAIISTASLGKATVLVDGNPLTRFATRTSRPYEPNITRVKFPSIIVVKTLEGRTIRDLTLPRETDAAWIGDDGRLIATYKWEVDAGQKLVRVQGTKVFDIVAYNTDVSIDDVDVDGNLAAVSLGGTTTLLDTTTGAKTHEVYNPSCAEYGITELERGGARVLTADDKDLIVYDRHTGRALGAARFATTVNTTTFIPHESSILVRLDDRILLWEPATNTTRQLAYRDAFDARISSNRRHAVVSLRNGRLALVDFAAFRAAMTPGPTLAKIEVPASCSTRDPFDLRDPEETHDDQTGDIDEEHTDGVEGDDEDTGD